MKLTTYRGYDIDVNENGGFTATNGESETEWRNTIQGIHADIDRLVAAAKKCNPPILVIVGLWGTIGVGELTSVDSEKMEAWMTSDKRRQKITIEPMWHMTPANQARLDELRDIQNKEKKLRDKRASVIASFELPLTIADIIKDKGGK